MTQREILPPFSMTPVPYYTDGCVTLYKGRAEFVLPYLTPLLDGPYTLVTDPPYPNNAGHFDADVSTARDVLRRYQRGSVITFWNETERPPIDLPLVAVHVWHRTNVNGRPYEPAYQFDEDGRKRRSDVMPHPAIFDGAGPGCREYVGHPTQKPVVIMRRLIEKTRGLVLDPFAGSGSTLVAAKYAGRKAIGIECEQDYCDLIVRRLSQGVIDFGEAS